jgi:trehalose-6-phosphatase
MIQVHKLVCENIWIIGMHGATIKAIKGAPNFKILTEISSQLWEFFVFEDFINLFSLISLHVIKFSAWERGLQNLKHII